VASALERVNAAWATRGAGGDVERRFNIDGWVSDYLLPANQVTFGGNTYPFGLNQTFLGTRTQEISSTLPGYLAALRMCPPAFAAQMVRALVLSQARFIFRNNRTSRTPGRTFGSSALAPLETPWPNGTTGELLARMEWHAGLAGNAYVTNRQAGRLRVLRPDWVVIVYGSQQEPDDAAHALDGEILGYAYCNGGISQGRNRVITLLPDEVAHWSPLPDPEGAGIGMSWITPAVREIQGDRAATDHKLQYFANGATPNLVVKGVTAASREQFDEIVDAMESKHAGLRNAYRTLYLAAGADATVVGSNLADLDLKSVNGSAETRISMLSRVHPTILGASEGLSGSSLNAGNFSSARRMWADSWIYPTLQDVAAALAPLIRVPSDAELWTTTADMPILREDAKDAADIEQVKATTINTLVTAGFTKDSIIAAVMAQDMSLLVDSGLVSVQLQPPGAAAVPAEVGGVVGPKVPPPPARAIERRKFNPDEPRIPGGPHGGEWSHAGADIKKALRDVLTGQDALDAAPATYRSGPDAHSGHYEGAVFDAPLGAGNEQALAEYEGVEYQKTNQYLRGGFRDVKPFEGDAPEFLAGTPERIAEIDKTMAVSRLTHDVEVSRAVKSGRDTFGPAWHEGVINAATTDFDEQDREYERWLAGERPDLTGLTWREDAYVSTSADPVHTEEFGKNWAQLAKEMPGSEGEPIIMTIRVPAGTGAIQLGDIGWTTLPNGRRIIGSAELMLQRGLIMRVVADHGVDDKGFRRLDVEATHGS